VLNPSSRIRVYVCREATDMRCSFNGLCGLVRGKLRQDPLSGHLFCFFNRRRNYVKVLYWDTSGYCIWAKRLVRGTFAVPSVEEIRAADLHSVLDGIDLKAAKRKKHFSFIPE